MVPLSQAITFEAFPPEEQGYAAGIYGIGAICGPILGPLLGGWITDNRTWPWIFYINVPIGIVAFFLATVFVKDPAYLQKPEGRVGNHSGCRVNRVIPGPGRSGSRRRTCWPCRDCRRPWRPRGSFWTSESFRSLPAAPGRQTAPWN